MTIEQFLKTLEAQNIEPQDYHRYELRILADDDRFGDLEVTRVPGRALVLVSSPDLNDALYDARDNKGIPEHVRAAVKSAVRAANQWN